MKAFPSTLSRNEALSDLRQLVNMITETHPDPYFQIGSQIEFFRAVNSILNDVPEEVDTSALHLNAMKISALAGDGHTSLDPLKSGGKKIWLMLEPVDETLLILGVYEEKHRKLIGSSVMAINGIAIERIKENMKVFRGANGENNNLMHLMECFNNKFLMSFVVYGKVVDSDSIQLTLHNHESGYASDVVFSFSERQPGELIFNREMELPSSESSDLSWTIFNGNKGYLKIESMRKYRENFESQLSNGASENFLLELMERSGIDTGETLEEAISKIPSATEIIMEFLEKVRENGIRNVIVDLRENTGGNSYLAYILSYLLFGDKILSVDEGYDVERYSEMYARQFDIGNFEVFPGGYNFIDEKRWKDGLRGMSKDDFQKIVNSSRSFSKCLKNHVPVHNLNVYVLCSARTFSAGFDLLSFLGKCGAKIIGVKPSQAANAFTNTIRYELEHSGLRGWISSKVMKKYHDKPMFYEITPDIQIGLENYKKHGYALDTTVAETMKLIGSK